MSIPKNSPKRCRKLSRALLVEYGCARSLQEGIGCALNIAFRVHADVTALGDKAALKRAERVIAELRALDAYASGKLADLLHGVSA